ncbi:MAG: helix-turn-helix domain-containing protein [Ketobacteraceae bacterium]|nr:helix-turn-helix domain-containing protein [Ketobacteraceae bacterium]
MSHITFLLCDRMLATSTTLPIEMLQTAEGAALSENRRKAPLQIARAAATPNPVASSSGFLLHPDTLLNDIEHTDLIYIPGLWRNPRTVIRKNRAITEFIQYHAARGTRICGVGTGCCFMAEAGLLDNKAATTHWYYFDQFQRSYPSAILKRQYFITQAGNLYCAASVNAMADLTVHFIKTLYSDTIANLVQRHFSHEIRKDYENIRFFEGDSDFHPDEDIMQAQTWMQDHYGEDFTLHALAEKFGMSTRTFNRRFKTATGKTPSHYLQEIRTRVAKELLQGTNLSIQEIALQVGYQDISHLAALFKKFLDTTPSEYRQTVRAKLFKTASPR